MWKIWKLFRKKCKSCKKIQKHLYLCILRMKCMCIYPSMNIVECRVLPGNTRPSHWMFLGCDRAGTVILSVDSTSAFLPFIEQSSYFKFRQCQLSSSLSCINYSIMFVSSSFCMSFVLTTMAPVFPRNIRSVWGFILSIPTVRG